MKTYTKGARLFVDYHFGGKPKAVCLEVVKPGTGQSADGLIRARLLETVGAYRKGEIVEVSTAQAVPVKQEFRKPGSFFRWVNTNYAWA